MGNTVPSAASAGAGGAPPDARVFLQNELNKFIIQVGQEGGRREGGREGGKRGSVGQEMVLVNLQT